MPYPGIGGYVGAVEDYRKNDRERLVEDLLSRVAQAPNVDLPGLQTRYAEDAARAYDATVNAPRSFGAGDVVGAPFALLRNLTAPIRRALGDRRQLSTDVAEEYGTPLASLATGVALPERQAGAGEALVSLFTDNADRKAAALRAFMNASKARRAMDRVTLQDAGLASDIFARNATGLNTSLEGLGEAQRQTYAPATTNAQLGVANTNMAQNLAGASAQSALAGKYAEEAAGERLRNRLSQQYGPLEAMAGIDARYRGTEDSIARAEAERAGMARDAELHPLAMDKARADIDKVQADTDKVYGQVTRDDVRLTLDQALSTARVDVAGEQANRLRAETSLVADRKKVLDAQIEAIKLRAGLSTEQAEVLRKRGKLLDAQAANQWLAADQSQEALQSRLDLDQARRDALIAAAEKDKTIAEMAVMRGGAEVERLTQDAERLRADTDLIGAKILALGGSSTAVTQFKNAVAKGVVYDAQARRLNAQAEWQEDRNAGRLSPTEETNRINLKLQALNALAAGSLSTEGFNSIGEQLGLEATGETTKAFGYGAPIVRRTEPYVAPTDGVGGVKPGTTSPKDAAGQLTGTRKFASAQEVAAANARGELSDAEAEAILARDFGKRRAR